MVVMPCSLNSYKGVFQHQLWNLWKTSCGFLLTVADSQVRCVFMTPPTYQLADHLLGGDLGVRLADWREAGHSYEWIAREVHTLTKGQVDVTFSTVRNWLALPALLAPAPSSEGTG